MHFGPVNPFNFFGYFTIQWNTILTIVAAIAGIAGFMSSGNQLMCPVTGSSCEGVSRGRFGGGTFEA